MSNVKLFPFGRVEASVLFDAARDVEFNDVVIIGITDDGDLYISATTDKLAEINAIVDIGKACIINQMNPEID